MRVEPFLLVAFVSLAAGVVLGYRSPRAWLALTVLGTFAGLCAGLQVLAGQDWEWRSGWLLGGQLLYLRLDGLSALFLVLVSAVGGAGAVYSDEYWSERHHSDSAPRGRAWWSVLLLSMGSVLTVCNGMHFLIVWEIFALSGYFLIVLDNERPAVRSAGWLYLAASHAGTMCLFAFFAALAARTGSWELGPMREHSDLAPLFWLALFGFGVKAGFFPLHIWLPSAHANAPSHVSAIMSGVAIKMGLYGIVRFGGWLPAPNGAGFVVTTLGATSALLGISFAFAQDDFKRLLAYCSVENMGIMLTGVGGALLAVAHGNALWGRLVLAGALLHVWNHGAFKSLLFFGAGSVLHSTSTREMSRLGGLWRAMPWTAGLFAIGCIAVSGLPPLNGFVSEWLVYLGLLDTVASKEPSAWPAVSAVILLAMAGALAIASFAKAWSMIFVGAPRTQAAAQAHECGLSMRMPMVALACVCVGTALAPVLLWPAVSRAMGSWGPGWDNAEMPASLLTLNAAQGILVMLLLAAAGLLWRKSRAVGMHRAPTWDCGYGAPTARMQYTSASFAGIASGWFRWILRPERKVRRPRGPFPQAAFRLERVPETMLERVIGPVGAAVMQTSSAVRRLQHGRLQFYILYALAGLIVVGVITALGGSR
jgi:hydrogenase-4 component B